jgi:hypothetical protein
MTNFPTEKELNILWAVATSSSIETGQRAHHIFARLLYNDLMNIKPPVNLADFDDGN